MSPLTANATTTKTEFAAIKRKLDSPSDMQEAILRTIEERIKDGTMRVTTATLNIHRCGKITCVIEEC